MRDIPLGANYLGAKAKLVFIASFRQVFAALRCAFTPPHVAQTNAPLYVLGALKFVKIDSMSGLSAIFY
jgi:hypothetical protein